MHTQRQSRCPGVAASVPFLVCLLGASPIQAAEAVDAPAQLPTVAVEANDLPPDGSAANGYRSGTAMVGALGETPLKETPYTVNSTSNALIENLQAQTVSEALKYNPTVYAASGNNMVGGGAAFTIRGFTSNTNESFIDGMRIYSRTPLEDKERVDVLNGPASFLYGFTSNPGGLVNYVLKKPTDQPLAKITIGDYGGAQAYAHGDFGGPLDSQGTLAYRMNLLYVDKGEVGIPNDSHERYLGSVTLDWHVAPDTLWSFDYSHYFIDVVGGDNIFTVGSKVTNIPKAPAASRNYMPGYSVSKDGYDRAASRLSSDLNETFSLRAAFAYDQITMFRHRASDQITDNAGDDSMSRNYYNTDKFTAEGNVFLDAKFATLGIGHKLTVGASEENTEYDYAFPYANQTVSFLGTNNIYNPQPYPADKSGMTIGSPNHATERTNLSSLVLADQIAFDDHWSLLAGVTRAAVVDENWSYGAYLTTGRYAEAPKYSRSEYTPAAALLFKPVPAVSAYLSYNEALQEGPTAPSTAANANATLAPYVSKQVEAGAKATLGAVDINAAVFRIQKANAYTNPATNLYTEDGDEVHLGGELVATGKLTPELTVTGGFTLLRATVDKAASASLDNKVPQGVPQEMARLYAEYAVPGWPGLTLTGGLSYTGSVYVDAANALPIPSVTVADLGARFQAQLYGHDVTFRANLANLTNQSYWVTSGGSLALGEPRTISFSTTLSF